MRAREIDAGRRRRTINIRRGLVRVSIYLNVLITNEGNARLTISSDCFSSAIRETLREKMLCWSCYIIYDETFKLIFNDFVCYAYNLYECDDSSVVNDDLTVLSRFFLELKFIGEFSVETSSAASRVDVCAIRRFRFVAVWYGGVTFTRHAHVGSKSREILSIYVLGILESYTL